MRCQPSPPQQAANSKRKPKGARVNASAARHLAQQLDHHPCRRTSTHVSLSAASANTRTRREQTIGQHQQQRLRHLAQAEGLTDMLFEQGKSGPRGAGDVATQQVTQRAQMLRDRLARAVGLGRVGAGWVDRQSAGVLALHGAFA